MIDPLSHRGSRACPYLPDLTLAVRFTVAIVATAASVVPVASADTARDVPVPRAVQPGVAITLYAREPDLATPVALDVDDAGRVWVIESNTHFQPPEYERHPTDRVLVFEGRTAAGRFERVSTFTDGLEQAMALRVIGPGEILLATRRDVMVLRDTDENGRADKRTYLARLETKEVYPHNGLTGFAVDSLGYVYFAIGENMGVPYRLVGTDGRTQEGGPDGGSIFRIRPDGTELERWAVGFWNTFHLAFDDRGRLFAVDNDPDSRPPCRLLHIVRGGDYGYRRWLGRKGLHPFTSWNGGLPGTLPMVAGTGEAPSGIVTYSHTALPSELYGQLLVTSWGDYRLESYRLEPEGASFRARRSIVVEGDDRFRPVGIAVAPDGAVFISDWVSKDYHVHAKGRIWRVAAASETATTKDDGTAEGGSLDVDDARIAFASEVRRTRAEAVRAVAREDGGSAIADTIFRRAVDSPGARYHAAEVFAKRGDWTLDRLTRGLTDADPDIRAATIRLASSTFVVPLPRLFAALTDASPRVQLDALLVLAHHRSLAPSHPSAADALARVRPFLASADPFLRSAAADVLLRLLDPDALVQSASGAPLEELDAWIGALRRSKAESARTVLPGLLEHESPAIRRAAIQWVGEEKLESFAAALDRAVRRRPLTREVVDAYLAAKTLLAGDSPERHDQDGRDAMLAALLLDSNQPSELREVAVRCLSPASGVIYSKRLAELLRGDGVSESLRLEIVRALATRGDSKSVLVAIAGDADAGIAERRAAVVGLAAFLPDVDSELDRLRMDAPDRLRTEIDRARRFARAPATNESSAERRAGALSGGNAAEGRFLFDYPIGPRCASCHTIAGRGGSAGPDLTTIGTRPRETIVDSVLEPAKDVAPQFAPWVFVTPSGTKSGTVLGEGVDGTILLGQANGEVERIGREEILERHAGEGSVMPADLTALLTDEELRDLIAYLVAQR